MSAYDVADAPRTAFEIYFSNQGNQGHLGRPSKQQLENVFGSSKEDDVVKFILEKGTLKAGEGFGKELSGINVSRYVLAPPMMGNMVFT